MDGVNMRRVGKNIIPGLSAKNTAKYLNHERKMQELSQKSDTKCRKEIQYCIQRAIQEGFSEKDIIDKLSSNEEFLKYKKYFKIWIENRMKSPRKITVEKAKKQNNEEEER